MTKTMTFAAVHLTVAFSRGYSMTGSLLIGAAIASVKPAVNPLIYFGHEEVWNRQKWMQWLSLHQFGQHA